MSYYIIKIHRFIFAENKIVCESNDELSRSMADARSFGNEYRSI